MARAITYKFKGQPRQIPFSYDKFHDIYEVWVAVFRVHEEFCKGTFCKDFVYDVAE